jgi:hypothetical protein
VQDEEVGAIELQEFEVPCYGTKRQFHECMDDYSQSAYDLATAVGKMFTEKEFGRINDIGTIVYFNAAWMRPDHARGAVWARLANQVISRMRRCAVIVAKAFPLDTSLIAVPARTRRIGRKRCSGRCVAGSRQCTGITSGCSVSSALPDAVLRKVGCGVFIRQPLRLARSPNDPI